MHTGVKLLSRRWWSNILWSLKWAYQCILPATIEGWYMYHGTSVL